MLLYLVHLPESDFHKSFFQEFEAIKFLEEQSFVRNPAVSTRFTREIFSIVDSIPKTELETAYLIDGIFTPTKHKYKKPKYKKGDK